MLVFLTSLGLLFSLTSAAPQVQLGRTSIVGRDIPSLHQEFFGGIPYAKPPIGDLRLRPPVLRKTLDTASFDAGSFGAACIQPDEDGTQSEDCLTINILRPAGITANALLPVLFWTHGGGFAGGSGSEFNGSAIVAQSVARGTPIIYVNFNYRLGPLGFPQGVEAERAHILNLGLRDQLAALQWIQKNIRAFGGDRTKVTAFGESAGAIMTSVLYLNSSLERLVRGTILESGSAATVGIFNASRGEPAWQAFVAGVPSCADKSMTGQTLDCLRKADTTEIARGSRAVLDDQTVLYTFIPTKDAPGGLIPDFPSRMLEAGKFARVPFIAGTNLDEGTGFVPRNISSEAELRALVTVNLSPAIVDDSQLVATTNKLLELYPDNPALGSPFGTGNQTFGLSSVYKQACAILGDTSFQSQRRAWSQTASKAGLKNYGYHFTQRQPQTEPLGVGVYHGSEIKFVYGSPPDKSPSALKLSAAMIDYWVSFAASGDPNDGRGNQRPVWAPYTPNNTVVMQLNGDDLKLIPDDYRAEQIKYINSVPLVFHHRRSN